MTPRPIVTEAALTDASRRFCGTVDRLQIREMAREARHDIRNQNYACAYVKLNQIYLLAGGTVMDSAAYARRQASIRRPKITEEPLVTVHLLNEIRKYCEGCGIVGSCASAKSAGALTACEMIRKAEPMLRAKAGC